MTRRAAHIDDNQPAIVTALVEAGCTVQSLAGVGCGCPDLLVGFKGVNVLLEVKNLEGLDGKVKRGAGITPDQLKWHRWYTGQVAVVHGPQEALDVVAAEYLRLSPAAK